ISVSRAESTDAVAGSDASYGALADLLENQQMREQLIQQLREHADQTGNRSSSVTVDDVAQPSIGSDQIKEAGTQKNTIADVLQAFATGLTRDFSETRQVLATVASGGSLPGKGLEQGKPAL